jgi:dihydroorotate dehydrogenase
MSWVYDKLLRRALFSLPAETAHEIGISTLRSGLASEAAQRWAERHFAPPDFGPIERFGLSFKSPLGMAAGFDKNGRVVNQLAALGFGFVEVGTVTFEPQPGNEKPRMFRLPQDRALINRLGFNNEGAESVVARLRGLKPKCVLGVNIGKNKNVPNEEATRNYLKSFDLAHPIADYIAINISSPNTPNLRELQRSESLEELLSAIQSRNAEFGTKPLLVKIAPDLTENEIIEIVDVCRRYEIAGMIATNTTVGRGNLRTPDPASFGAGGLSGKPLANRSSEVISIIYRETGGKMPIIGVGGIFTAQDAFEKIAAGASLVQAYTGFIYGGISFARDINYGLAQILKEKGFRSIDEAIGSSVNGTEGAR